MRRGFRTTWVGTGLALVGAMIVGAREARAEVGIVINNPVEQPGSGDPPYDYFFSLYLTPGYSVSMGDSFTVAGLVGVTQANISTGWAGSMATTIGRWGDGVYWTPSIDQTEYYSSGVAGSENVSNVSWIFLGTSTISDSSTSTEDLFLGRFEVQTTDTFTSPPISGTTDVYYGYTATGPDGSTVTITPGQEGSPVFQFAVAPEPASSTMVMLAGVSAASSALAVRARRRRPAGGTARGLVREWD